ncbi:conserved hypothetical protein [Leishmania major strain Friedlin]|uniref:Uncharacterized protein n=1 Tax=Leishmania major TaxID=5664 RepID=Q4QAQ5_LEIMA|nr:conserved hypothetical protein [Leishmania major strain Friedlin]CAG9574545.1 hypothetical_protein_-_conserved [Leishmania major strain Friedlin]CAJ04477.1 conserved hypothetical protein [Leishmania major strain Friedlin]|eukprot:XP_001683593.1 conserved hypothetical protein [Leishmania major strain Friedlin]
MNTNGRSAYDMLARMSDEEDDDVPEDLELTFVPASKRREPASSHAVGHHAGNAVPSTLNSPTHSGPAVINPKPRAETVYEQERNAKVRQVLAEQQKTALGVVFSLDAFEAPSPGRYTLAGLQEATGTPAPSCSSAPYNREDQRRGFSQYRGRGGAEGGGRGGPGGGGGPRRYRMPNPNMSGEEQARYIRHRRNMAVIRNALREVDPETLEYMQVTQAPDQLPLNRNCEGFSKPYFSTDRGRGGVDAGGGRSTSSYRGRGGGGGMHGRGGRGFSPYSVGRGTGATRGDGLGRGAGGGCGRSAPFSPYS